jgi:hypothetical protein
MLIGADLPLLVIGFSVAKVTGYSIFSLSAWLSVVLITVLAVWAANRNVSYGYWLGILTSSIGLSVLILYRLLWEFRAEYYENLHRLPAILRAVMGADIMLFRTIGLFALAVGALFLVYDAIVQRRA